jgi:hypothetical protein
MAKVAINLVAAPMARSERNTQPAALPQAHVRKEAKVNLGAKKLRRNQNLKEKRSETYKQRFAKNHQRRAFSRIK